MTLSSFLHPATLTGIFTVNNSRSSEKIITENKDTPAANYTV